VEKIVRESNSHHGYANPSKYGEHVSWDARYRPLADHLLVAAWLVRQLDCARLFQIPKAVS
jgi:hypothetical protein